MKKVLGGEERGESEERGGSEEIEGEVKRVEGSD